MTRSSMTCTFCVLSDLSLTVASHTFTTLLGPSGCGKTRPSPFYMRQQQAIREKLSQRMFRLIYKSALHQCIETADVVFQPENFKHLTGIQTDIRPWRFYDACLKRRLFTLKKQSIREVVKKECKVYAIAAKSLYDDEGNWELTYCEQNFVPTDWL